MMKSASPLIPSLAMVLLATVAASGTALAQDKGHGHDGNWRMPGGALLHHMKDADTNQDGTVDKTEYDAERTKVFATLSKDGKGVSKADFSGAIERLHAERRRKQQERHFDKLDKDKNGIISDAEFKTAGDELFTKLDKDKDGKLTPRHRHDGPHGDTNKPAR